MAFVLPSQTPEWVPVNRNPGSAMRNTKTGAIVSAAEYKRLKGLTDATTKPAEKPAAQRPATQQVAQDKPAAAQSQPKNPLPLVVAGVAAVKLLTLI